MHLRIKTFIIFTLLTISSCNKQSIKPNYSELQTFHTSLKLTLEDDIYFDSIQTPIYAKLNKDLFSKYDNKILIPSGSIAQGFQRQVTYDNKKVIELVFYKIFWTEKSKKEDNPDFIHEISFNKNAYVDYYGKMIKYVYPRMKIKRGNTIKLYFSKKDS